VSAITQEPPAKYRDQLPQLSGDVFITDGGLETTLIFHEGLDLPDFASFVVLTDPDARAVVGRDYGRYAEVARRHDVGLVAETATWRASADWASRLGRTAGELAAANRDAVALLEEVRAEHEAPGTPIVISGCVGPRGDGYDPGEVMTTDEAEAYHAEQIATFASTSVDLVSAITMTNVPEAVGITRAAVAAGLPVVISFTVETDGRLPTGQSLQEAVEAVDAATGGAPAYFMINCAHPTHFAHVLDPDAAWTSRIQGIRANASTMSHAELDEATELDRGDPVGLGDHYRTLREAHDQISVLGGCCGTDQEHVAAVAAACAV
jgi:homocysteine S-methyltransferase